MERFNSIWLVDFEFKSDAGERPVPVCMVAREVRSGRLIRLFPSLRFARPRGVRYASPFHGGFSGCSA